MVQALRPRSQGIYLDGTVGAGGYAEAILEASSPDGVVVGLDLDPAAAAAARTRLARFGERFIAVHEGFHKIAEIVVGLGIARFDAAVIDLGLSSDQLDDAQRGFSFRFEGPLDMRFNTAAGIPLIEELARMSVGDLSDILATYGEERRCKRIARSVMQALEQGRLSTTSDLERIVTQAAPRGRSRIHPATRTFQALRIHLNRELEHLDAALEAIPRLLSPGGRFCVVSYHSLEDRRVKLSFRERARDAANWTLITVKPIRPTPEEAHANPRSRSARLRVIEAAGRGAPERERPGYRPAESGS